MINTLCLFAVFLVSSNAHVHTWQSPSTFELIVPGKCYWWYFHEVNRAITLTKWVVIHVYFGGNLGSNVYLLPAVQSIQSIKWVDVQLNICCVNMYNYYLYPRCYALHMDLWLMIADLNGLCLLSKAVQTSYFNFKTNTFLVLISLPHILFKTMIKKTFLWNYGLLNTNKYVYYAMF